MHIKRELLGAKGFKAFCETHGGRYLSSPNSGRIFRGREVAAALRAEGFVVEPWTGPRDPGVSDAAWARHVAATAERGHTFIARTPYGAIAV